MLLMQSVYMLSSTHTRESPYRRLGNPTSMLCISQGLVQAGQHDEEDAREQDEDARQGQRGLEACHDQHEQHGGDDCRRQLDKGVPLQQL